MGSNSVAALGAIAATVCVLSCGRTRALGDGFDVTDDATGGRGSAAIGGSSTAAGAKSTTGGEPTSGSTGDPLEPELAFPLDTCGDAVIASGELCDDGNAVSGDGCDAECRVEAGFECAVPGLPCQRVFEVCEDGCFAGAICVERNSGFECACPEQQPESCEVAILALPRGSNARCTPYALSNDGATAAGTCDTIGRKRPGSLVLWHLGRSIRREELPNTTDFVPTGISADGSVVVGRCPQGTFYWTRERTEIIRHDGFRRASVSGDGTTVVGTEGVGPVRPFLWTEADGLVLLPEPEDGADTTASSISDDGRVIGGMSRRRDGNSYAVRWNASGEVEWLPIGEGVNTSEVIAISADGETLVGYSTRDQKATEGELWTTDTVSTALPEILIAVSDDGTAAVGQSGFYFDGGKHRSVGEFLPSLSEYWSSLTIVGASGDLKTLVATASPNRDDPTSEGAEAILLILPP